MAQWHCPYNIQNGHGWSCKRENNGDRKIRAEPCTEPCYRLIDKPRKTEIHKLVSGYCCIGSIRDWCGHVHDKPTTAYDCCMMDIAYSRDVLGIISDRRIYNLKSLIVHDGEPKLGGKSYPLSNLEIAIEPRTIFFPIHKGMRQLIHDRKKCMASRNKYYGRPGDRFLVDDEEYIIEWVMPFRVGYVACFLYRYEGFNSSREFMDYKQALTRGRAFDPDKIVFTHKFFPSFSTANKLSRAKRHMLVTRRPE